MGESPALVAAGDPPPWPATPNLALCRWTTSSPRDGGLIKSWPIDSFAALLDATRYGIPSIACFNGIPNAFVSLRSGIVRITLHRAIVLGVAATGTH